jgi:YbbR domain-containing protein
LRARLTGDLPSGYSLVAINILPDQVVVQGAEGEIAAVSEVMTERIDLGEIKGSTELTVPLDYRGKYSQVKEVKNAIVRLQIKTGARDKVSVKSPGEGKL